MMELFYYRDPNLNFGDDLNEAIWPRVLSEKFRSANHIVLIGIGSILTEERVGKFAGQGRKVVVLGSGTSYGRQPTDMEDWSVLAVRGPLTGAVIGRPDRAITDGAILLALCPDLIGPSQTRDLTLFIPHHKTILATPWKQIVEACGMTYVSPQQPVADIMRLYARAKLVVTEAMHGAIVADTLRIPWVPILISPAVEEFKWRDWCSSMELPFEPRRIPAGAAYDVRAFSRMTAVLSGAGLGRTDHLAGIDDPAALKAFLDRRFAPPINDGLRQSLTIKGLARWMVRGAYFLNPTYRRRSERALIEAMCAPPLLSGDSLFQQRLEQMRGAVAAAEALA